MPVVVAVLGAALAALLVMLASVGLSRLVVDPVPQPVPDAPRDTQSDQDEKPVTQRWLVDHLARVRGIRHVVRVFDRFVFGGALVGIALVALLAGATLIGWLLSTVDSNRGFAQFDESAAQWGSDHATEASTMALRWITQLGASIVLITLMAVVGLIIAVRQRRHDQPRWVVLGFLLTVGIGIVIVNNALKWTVDRDRPTVNQLVHASGSSFPSGHSAAAAACWAAIALIGGRRLPEHHRRWAAAIAVSIAVAVASSRVLLGVHWLTDVIAGVIVGWTWFFLVALVFGGRLQRFGAPVEDVAARASQVPDAAPQQTPEQHDQLTHHATHR